jgi:hypothetical protein
MFGLKTENKENTNKYTYIFYIFSHWIKSLLHHRQRWHVDNMQNNTPGLLNVKQTKYLKCTHTILDKLDLHVL